MVTTLFVLSVLFYEWNTSSLSVDEMLGIIAEILGIILHM